MPVHTCLAVVIKLGSSLKVREDEITLKCVDIEYFLVVLICLGVSMFVSALVHRVCATTW